MFRKDMLDYYNNRVKKLYQFHALAYGKNDPDGVHDLRVGLKYLRAYFNLVGAINQDFNAKKNFRAFRQIAKNTCCLRDIQVQQKLRGKTGGTLNIETHEYEDYLAQIEKKSFEQFRAFTKKNSPEKLKRSKKVIKKALAEISPIRAETRAEGRFYNLRNNLIFLNRENRLKDDILHKVRILSKLTHHTLDIIRDCFHIFGDSKEFVGKIAQLHKQLGNWHDYDVGMAYIDKFIETQDSGFEAEPYIRLKEHMAEKKETLGKNLRKTYDDFATTAAVYEHRK